jgi:hypothetical protein
MLSTKTIYDTLNESSDSSYTMAESQEIRDVLYILAQIELESIPDYYFSNQLTLKN